MIKVGVIGCGYWGPNLIRNLYNAPNCEVVICCDRDESRLAKMKSLYPRIQTTTDQQALLYGDIDAVCIATPVSTHYPLAKAFLEANKHVFVEKPITHSSASCMELIRMAEQRQKVLMVGHTFEYTAAVNKIKEIIDSGELGEMIYISSTRVNLGLFQPDINVIWDLAPHDISIISYILQEDPITVNAQGRSHYNTGIEEVAMTTLNYGSGAVAFLHHSWVDPNKIRSMVFVGTKKMLVYDDISPNEKIKIFDKGVERPQYYDNFGEFQFAYRYGDIYIPRVEEYEALGAETRHFIECIESGSTPRSDGHSGLRVVRIIEAANESLDSGGSAIAVISEVGDIMMPHNPREAVR